MMTWLSRVTVVRAPRALRLGRVSGTKESQLIA